jgi:hypothetical protein
MNTPVRGSSARTMQPALPRRVQQHTQPASLSGCEQEFTAVTGTTLLSSSARAAALHSVQQLNAKQRSMWWMLHGA